MVPLSLCLALILAKNFASFPGALVYSAYFLVCEAITRALWDVVFKQPQHSPQNAPDVRKHKLPDYPLEWKCWAVQTSDHNVLVSSPTSCTTIKADRSLSVPLAFSMIINTIKLLIEQKQTYDPIYNLCYQYY